MRDLTQIAPLIIAVFPDSYDVADTMNKGFILDLSLPEEAFLGLCLGIMYAFPILPKYADETMRRICSAPSNREVFSIDYLASRYRSGLLHLTPDESLKAVPDILPRTFEIVKDSYKRVPRLIVLNIAKAAHIISENLDGDVTRLFQSCNYDGRLVIKTMQSWKVRLSIKAFWFCREMRQQKVWFSPSGDLIDGSMCCVVDIQVTRALNHLDCYDNTKDIFYHSEAIWQSFGELYDLPLLWLARTFYNPKRPQICPLAAHKLCACESDGLRFFH